MDAKPQVRASRPHGYDQTEDVRPGRPHHRGGHWFLARTLTSAADAAACSCCCPLLLPTARAHGRGPRGLTGLAPALALRLVTG